VEGGEVPVGVGYGQTECVQLSGRESAGVPGDQGIGLGSERGGAVDMVVGVRSGHRVDGLAIERSVDATLGEEGPDGGGD
jgi:hypothetical protein